MNWIVSTPSRFDIFKCHNLIVSACGLFLPFAELVTQGPLLGYLFQYVHRHLRAHQRHWRRLEILTELLVSLSSSTKLRPHTLSTHYGFFRMFLAHSKICFFCSKGSEDRSKNKLDPHWRYLEKCSRSDLASGWRIGQQLRLWLIAHTGYSGHCSHDSTEKILRKQLCAVRWRLMCVLL